MMHHPNHDDPPDNIFAALARPAAFSFALPPSEPQVIQTHASVVFLAGERAYKLKKPVNLGFLDYSTPHLRRHFCQEEVRLNQRLAPAMYLGVAPVVLDGDGQLHIGELYARDVVPEYGTVVASGTVIDFLVVMTRLREEDTLAARVRSGTATNEEMASIARRVAAFHAAGALSPEVQTRYGSLEIIGANWQENLAQMRPLLGRALDVAGFEVVERYGRAFMQQRAPLFQDRVKAGYIRNCHGDLRPEHIYLLPAPEHSEPEIAVVDCIEFADRLRYGDVASEVAFLAMELDALGRCDLSRAFLDAYVAASADEGVIELLPFYACYRACVRGKVAGMLAEEDESSPEQRSQAYQQAQLYFALAAHYATTPVTPVMLLIGGLMGTGKSTLAARLQRELGYPLFASDRVRMHLVESDPWAVHAEDFAQGIYTPEWNMRTYATLCDAAKEVLQAGHSVILDATFMRHADRLMMGDMAQHYEARAIFVACHAPREETLARLAQRWQVRLREANGRMGSSPMTPSDGRPELYDAQARAWEGWEGDEERQLAYLPINTVEPLTRQVERVCAALHSPRFACWLYDNA